MDEQDLAMLRRKFLRSIAAGAAACLSGGDPPPLSVEGMQITRIDLDAHWRNWMTGKAAEIEQITALHADRLVRALREAPESSKLYRQLATATTEAAMLAVEGLSPAEAAGAAIDAGYKLCERCMPR